MFEGALNLMSIVHTFIPRTQEAEAGGSLEIKASLVYGASYRTSRDTHRDTLHQKHRNIKKKKSENSNNGALPLCLPSRTFKPGSIDILRKVTSLQRAFASTFTSGFVWLYFCVWYCVPIERMALCSPG